MPVIVRSRSEVSPVRHDLSPLARPISAPRISARSRSITTTTPSPRPSAASKIELRPFTMWRYQEFLPLDGEPTVGLQVGGTPLITADRLAAALGVDGLWIKNDAVNFPTLSFKDRVVAVALSKAREFGFTTVGCASTGNLANSVAANAAAAGLDSYIFVPADLERAKILGTSVFGAKVIRVKGTYDEVNRLCTQVAFKYGWGFVNVNLRPFYAEGSKTFGFEIAEQLGWRTPQHVVCPMAGGSLIGKIHKAFNELHSVGLIDRRRPASSTAPRRPAAIRSATAVKNGWETPSSGAEAEHDRQVAGHRRPRRRLLRREADPRVGRLGRGRHRRRDRRRDGCCWPAPKASSPRRPAASRWPCRAS